MKRVKQPKKEFRGAEKGDKIVNLTPELVFDILVGVIVTIILVPLLTILVLIFVIPVKENNKLQKERDAVLKTRLLNARQAYRTVTKSALGGAIKGGIFGGDMGALLGAAAALEPEVRPDGTDVIFLVTYKDGTRKINTVKKGSKLCDLYLERLEEGEGNLAQASLAEENEK